MKWNHFSVWRLTFILKIKNVKKNPHIGPSWRSYNASLYSLAITTEDNMSFTAYHLEIFFLKHQSWCDQLASPTYIYIYGPIARKLYRGLFPKSIFQSPSTAQNQLNIVSLYLWLYEKKGAPPPKFLFSFCQN